MRHGISKQYAQAMLFFLFIVFVFCFSLYEAFVSAGPVVLGTELNTNGLVEYLCLGKGCETLP